MTKHSKNNTASSIFSYAEYKKLDYGTKRQRLGNESMRRFDACALCLQRARDPVACQKGHLFCKECALTDLVGQMNDIKRQKVRLEAMKKEAEEERERAQEAARERVLREFEKGQLGLAAVSSISTSSRADSSDARGSKRKFDFDASAVDTLTREAEEAALRQIEREQAEALKSKLPDFWLPSLTPTYTSHGPPTSLAQVKLQTTCRGGNPAHQLSRKNLIPVKWTFDTSSNSVSQKSVESTPATDAGDQSVEPKPRALRDEEQPPMCPSCKKQLSNNTFMNLMKPCGHVTCKTCTDALVKPAMQCILCDVKLGEKDVIELTREGMGAHWLSSILMLIKRRI
ncbi:Nitric oxide synthase-interacting protein [Trametes pubescens]|uniref:Nitric oxide synthase-interacting protein n=1 Tax=Trametes pubescens TaxID=154538 RepID=A0A1M2VGT7_TRAPU|nr:Nitric oxide synthase-interacting protein [Trametes pubescens]